MSLGQRDISLAVPSLVVVLLAAFGILSSPPRLDSLRPPAPAEQPGSKDERVPARLWQDPLQILWELEEKEVITAQEIKSQLTVERTANTLVLGVLVPGSRYSESYEKRRRTRYAVLTGLGAMKYYPAEGDRIGILCSRMNNKLLLETPFEWFELNETDARKGDYRHVLLLWLDEDQLRLGVEGEGEGVLHPAHDLYHKIIPEGVAHGPKLDLNIIGPSSSNELQAYFEAKSIKEPMPILCGDDCPLRKSYLLSPWSTAIEEPDKTEGQAEERRPESGENELQPILKFAPMIGTDSQLYKELLKEFSRRGFDPNRHAIALLSEWDTFYGRNFVKKLRETTAAEWPGAVPIHHLTYMQGIDGQRPGKKPPPEKRGSAGKAQDPLNPSAHAAHVEWPEGESQYDYLRRIRRILEDINSGPKPVRVIGVTGSDVHDKLLVLRAIRRSFPDVCFFTTDLDVRLLHPGEYPWTRNLIIASHYGLAPEGPPSDRGCETLEERLTDTIHRRHDDQDGQENCEPTSGAGGSPGVKFPLFRYSYQTAVMLSVVASLSEETLFSWQRDKVSRVRLYEVGRKRARLLNVGPSRGASAESPLLTLLGTILAAIVVGAYAPYIHRLNGRLRLQFAALASIAIAIALFCALGYAIYFDQRSGGEHLFWFEGVSIWPSEILLLSLALLSCYFVVLVWRNFQECLASLQEDFFDAGGAKAPTERVPGVAAQQLWQAFRNRFSGGAQAKRLAGYGFVLLAVVLLATFHFHQRPARGDLARNVDFVLLNAGLLGLGLVVCLLLDITFHTWRLVDKIANKETYWRSHGNRENSRLFSDFLDVSFIGELTRFHSKQVYFPFVLLLILGVAHYPVFDKFVIGRIETATFLIFAVLAGLPLILIRLCAESARRKALRNVARKRRELLGLPDNQEQMGQLDRILGEIEAIRAGAFSSLRENPALRAALIPFGGLGGLALLEFYLG